MCGKTFETYIPPTASKKNIFINWKGTEEDIIFRTSFNIIVKKYFCHIFSCFNRFTQTPIPQPPYRQKFAAIRMTSFFC